MKLLLCILAATGCGLTDSKAQTLDNEYSKLIGTWNCSTSYEDGKSITRLINETVFEASGKQSVKGFIQWFDNDGGVTASYQTVSDVRLKDDTFFVELETLSVGEVRFRGTTTNSPYSVTQFNNSVEENVNRDAQSVFDIVELNNDRFVAIGQEDSALNVCVRKG